MNYFVVIDWKTDYLDDEVMIVLWLVVVMCDSADLKIWRCHQKTFGKIL